MQNKHPVVYISSLIVSVVILFVISIILSDQEDIVFSHQSGFYEEPFELKISTEIAGAKIYYTIDGSVPDCSDYLYTAPILLTETQNLPNRLSARTDIIPDGAIAPEQNVKKAHVIRAVAITPWGTNSSVLNGTFFIGYDREQEFGSVPIISIMIEEQDLFDYETGIYVNGKTYDDWITDGTGFRYWWILPTNYTNSGFEWERTAWVEYLPESNSSGFAQNMGLRIKGGASRLFEQKSLRLTARKEYGDNAIRYPIFPDNKRRDGKGEVKEYKTIVLRNGGNDFYSVRIRDPLIQKLSAGMPFDTQASLPCIAFINGEYWGVYTLTEQYNDNYVENTYGIDKNNVVSYKSFLIEDGTEQDVVLYDEMIDFIVSHDMAQKSNYEKASEMLDMASYSDYCALQFYICNVDGIFNWNNFQMWRVRVPYVDENKTFGDGKWRMMLYDTESSMGFDGREQQYLEEILTPIFIEDSSEDEQDPKKVFRALWKNEEFRREMVLSMCDIRNIYFEKNHALEVYEDLRSQYETLLPETFLRFPTSKRIIDDSKLFIENEMSQIARFITLRYDYFPRILQESLGLSDPCTIKIQNTDNEKGTVLLNQNKLSLEEEFRGVYFPEYSISLRAIPEKDHVFVCWKINDEYYSDSQSIEIWVDDKLEITAVFE